MSDDDLAQNINEMFSDPKLHRPTPSDLEPGLVLQEEPTSIPAILAALADGCARIIEASARANSGPGPKDKGETQ